jgi:hypothetical protein
MTRGRKRGATQAPPALGLLKWCGGGELIQSSALEDLGVKTASRGEPKRIGKKWHRRALDTEMTEGALHFFRRCRKGISLNESGIQGS